jgi:hypothetical protein
MILSLVIIVAFIVYIILIIRMTPKKSCLTTSLWYITGGIGIFIATLVMLMVMVIYPFAIRTVNESPRSI